MWLIRLLAKMALFMFVFPALGLLAFHAGLGMGLLAALLVGIVGVCAAIFLLPELAVGGGLAALLGGALFGEVGVWLVGFALLALINALAIAAVAWIVPGIALVGFWPTVGAGAILGLVGKILG